MSTLNERLKKLRTSKNLTQEECARFLSINRATLANWETGRTEPDVQMLVAIANFFAVSLDDLLGRQSPSSTPVSEVNQEIMALLQALPEKERLRLLETLRKQRRANES